MPGRSEVKAGNQPVGHDLDQQGSRLGRGMAVAELQTSTPTALFKQVVKAQDWAQIGSWAYGQVMRVDAMGEAGQTMKTY